jgi:hypothetical protein
MYNTGRYNPGRGLKQGFFDGVRFYGQAIFDYLVQVKSISPP